LAGQVEPRTRARQVWGCLDGIQITLGVMQATRVGLEQKQEMAISPIGEDIGMNPPSGLKMLLGTDAW